MYLKAISVWMDRNIKFPLKLWEAVTIHLLFSQDHQSAKSVWFYKIGNQGFGTKWDQNGAKGDRNQKFPLELDNPVTMHFLFSEDHNLAKSYWFYKNGNHVFWHERRSKWFKRRSETKISTRTRQSGSNAPFVFRRSQLSTKCLIL